MISFAVFCKRHPALLYALFFLLGLSFVKSFNGAFLLPFFALLIPSRKIFSLVLCFIVACFYGHHNKEIHPSEKITKGRFLFTPTEIKEERSHFKKSKVLKGTLQCMDISIKNIPCSIALSSSMKRPFIDASYELEGSLEKKGEEHVFFTFKPEKWEKVPYSFSLVEWRFQAKQFLSQKIRLLFADSKVADLIVALTLGSLDDRMLKFDFARLGLQHVLAISGFHFGLLAFFLGLFFRTFLKEKTAYIALLLCLTSYFLLLGSSPSILRAYLALCLYLIGKLNRWRTNGLNLLGATLFLETLLNPRVISHLGFQLSFLATFSILFLLPLSKKWMLLFFPRREDAEILKFNGFERWCYLICCFLRSATALNIAVGLSTTAVCLFYFHKFPIMSLAYNLFIPLSLSLSLFLFFASLPFFLLIPPVAHFLSYCNELFTREILGLITQSPIFLDVYLRVETFPLSVLVVLLLGVFSLPFIVEFLKLRKNNRSVRQNYSSYSRH